MTLETPLSSISAWESAPLTILRNRCTAVSVLVVSISRKGFAMTFLKTALSFILTLSMGTSFAQFSTGPEKYDLACGQKGIICLQDADLRKLIGKKMTYKHPKAEYEWVSIILNQDGTAEVKNAKNNAGRAFWSIEGEKLSLKIPNWSDMTTVIVKIGNDGSLLIAPSAGNKVPMLLPLDVE